LDGKSKKQIEHSNNKQGHEQKIIRQWNSGKNLTKENEKKPLVKNCSIKNLLYGSSKKDF
jgi:hypothetical protein